MEFTKYPKTPRLFRNCVITEKIDGTNAAVVIEKGRRETWNVFGGGPEIKAVFDDDYVYYVGAQSRNRMITPEVDNAGFAKWVEANADSLVKLLGPGVHFGEWWGQGIQRGYGLDHKRFSLFNTGRWSKNDLLQKGLDLKIEVPESLDVVPVLYQGTFNTAIVENTLDYLGVVGSVAANRVYGGKWKAEGVVVYHAASGQVFKALVENDELPKGQS